MADHEHRAYEVWDGASSADVERLERLINIVEREVDELRQVIREMNSELRELQS